MGLKFRYHDYPLSVFSQHTNAYKKTNKIKINIKVKSIKVYLEL